MAGSGACPGRDLVKVITCKNIQAGRGRHRVLASARLDGSDKCSGQSGGTGEGHAERARIAMVTVGRKLPASSRRDGANVRLRLRVACAATNLMQ